MKFVVLIAGWMMASILHAAPVILVFGDSLSAGYGLSAGQGWVSLLEKQLAGSHRIVNASISGETTAGGLARLDHALRQHKPAIVLLELGANDGLRGLPLNEAERNLQQMLDKIGAARAQVLLIGMRLPPNYGPVYTREFDSVYHKLAQRNKIPLLPFLMEGFAGRRDYFLPDGIHPSAAAQPYILANVQAKLRPLLAGHRKR